MDRVAVAPAAESASSKQEGRTSPLQKAGCRTQSQVRFPHISPPSHSPPPDTSVAQHRGSHPSQVPTCHHSCGQIPQVKLCSPLSWYRQRVRTRVQMGGLPQNLLCSLLGRIRGERRWHKGREDFTKGLLIAQTVKTHLQQKKKKREKLCNIVWIPHFVLFNPLKLFPSRLGSAGKPSRHTGSRALPQPGSPQFPHLSSGCPATT